MIRNKWCDAVCVIVICLAVIVTALFMNGESIGIKTVHDEDTEVNEDDSDFTENDMNGDWDTSSAASITLSDDGISIDGDGAYELNGDLIIAKSGEYVISGELSDGSIIIDAEDNSKIWIQLDGVTLSADDDACFKVEQADKVFLTLADGSVNSMTSGEEMSDEALEDGVDGTIFAHDDLTINGNGSLVITSGYKFGIAANDDLVITGGNISINAESSGVHVNDSLRINGTVLDISSGSDGLHAGGNILIASGNITIDAGDDGIHSDDDVTIDDGTIIINKCYEGIEGMNITVNGGDITIYPSDDGFNAADGSASSMGFGMGLHIGGGQAENENIPAENGAQSDERDTESIDTVNSEINTMPPERPDGFAPGAEAGNNSNAGAGMDEHGWNDGNNVSAPAMPDQGNIPDESADSFNKDIASDTDDGTSDSTPSVTINGGKITIVNSTGQDADGIDSNGDIVINGGEVYVSMAGNGTNCALDYGSESGGECLINGGTVIACGGSSMIEEVSSSSDQCSIMYTTAAAGEDDTELVLSDSEGHELSSWTVPCGFTSATVSCTGMEEGSTYILEIGDETEKIELSDTVTTAGSSVSENHDMGYGMQGGMSFQHFQNSDTDDKSPSNSSEEMHEKGPNMMESENMQGQQSSLNMDSAADADTVEDTEKASDEDFDISENLIYVFASVGVLAIGIVGVLLYKKRK